jgi:hypothetical protein
MPMASERDTLSPTQIGISVLWSTWWTGLPIKLPLAVLVLAMGLMHLEARLGLAFLMLLASPVTVFGVPIVILTLDGNFGEGIGLPLLLILSIPIDIWAFGVVGSTFFLEHLRKEPPPRLGLTLWWKSAVVGAFFLPILWVVVGTVTETAMSTSHSLAQMETLRHLFDTGLPVAERIGLEVTIWGTASFGLLLILLTIGVSTIGRMIRDIAAMAAPASGTYQSLITRWDLMRVPRDQGLFMTTVVGTGVVLCILFWAFMPITTPHPHECCLKPEVKAPAPFKPMETLARSEQQINQLLAQVEALEEQKASSTTQTKGGAKAESQKASENAAP